MLQVARDLQIVPTAPRPTSRTSFVLISQVMSSNDRHYDSQLQDSLALTGRDLLSFFKYLLGQNKIKTIN